MKSMIALAIVGVLAVTVRAHGGGFGGFYRGCQCLSQCSRNTGSKNIQCNSTAYLQCQDTTCAVQVCPDGQLFNKTTQACQACPAGFHVDALRRRCVCNSGTTLDYQTRACVACPTGATVTDDYCYCNNSVFIPADNVCKKCPDDSTYVRGHCVCNDAKAFWNNQAFECQQCPGQWVNKTYSVRGAFRRNRNVTYEICECTAPLVFNRVTVSCVTCPVNSTVSTSSKGESFCSCNGNFRYYDRNNTCIDRRLYNSHEDSASHEFDFGLRDVLKDLFGSAEEGGPRRG